MAASIPMPRSAAYSTVVSLIRRNWLVCIIGIITIYLLKNYFHKGLYKVPGPFLRRVSVIPRLIDVFKGRSHKTDIALHKKYGKIVRLSPNQLSISDTNEINAIYGVGTNFYKSGFYSLAAASDEEGLLPDTFVLTDRTLHTRMKRNAANAYSLNGLVQMESCFEPVTERLLQLLDKNVEDASTIDLGNILQNYTMDAIFQITYGRDFNYLEKGDVLGLSKIIIMMMNYMAIFGQISWSHRLLLGNKLVAGYILGDASSFEGDILAMAMAEIKASRDRKSEDGQLTFLQRLLLNQQKSPDSIKDREVITHAFGNITAGSDTTAIALRSIMWQLLTNTEVYDKLLAEIQDAQLELPVQFNKANKMPYLAAVIQEALRIHPAVGMMLERTTPVPGADLCGHHIPAGVDLGINAWVLHHDADVFPEPEKFYPERWLPSVTDELHLKRMHRSFFAFGHGAHTCSGRWVSHMEIAKLIPTLLLRYKFSLVDGNKPLPFKNRWFTPQSGLRVKILRRETDMN